MTTLTRDYIATVRALTPAQFEWLKRQLLARQHEQATSLFRQLVAAGQKGGAK